MVMRTARKTRSIAILATLGMLSAIGTSAAQDFEKTVKAARDGSVSIENVAGEVIVTGWDRDEVEVKATVGGRVEAVEVEVDEEGDVEIEVDVPDRMRGGYEADLTIRVPKGARLSVETVSAGIRVTDVAGLLELASVSGGIDVEADARSLEAVTVSGAIDVRGKFDRVEAESVSGQIDIRDASEEVEVSTTSGDIEVRGGPFRTSAWTASPGRSCSTSRRTWTRTSRWRRSAVPSSPTSTGGRAARSTARERGSARSSATGRPAST
jgi:DUF4097 and DUF4098 domain-containing protein YvlB